MVGYAVPGRIRSAEPPVMGRRFVERMDWLNYIVTIPAPRVVVLQDVDHIPGTGAFWDEVHARIHLRLDCVGAVTNGAVRDLPKIKPTGFSLYAASVSAAQGCYGVTCQYISPEHVFAGCSGTMLLLSGHDCFPFPLIRSVKGTGRRGSAAATIDHSVIRALYKPHDN